MYEEVGSKIRKLSQVLGWVSLIGGIVAWLYFLTNTETYYGETRIVTDDDFIAWIALVYGVIGFLSSWFIYGFGQLVDDVHDMSYQMERVSTASSKLVTDPFEMQKILLAGGWQCSCGNVNPKNSFTCSCGKSRFDN